MKNVKYLEVEVSPFGFVQEENKNFCLRELVKKYPAKAGARKSLAKKFLSTFFKVGISCLLFLFPLNSAKNYDLTPSEIIKLTNDQRQANHLGELNIDEKLTQAAYNKAQDMIAKNYFNHFSPENKKPWDFINETGYQYFEAGENLAIDSTNPKQIIKTWMASEMHRDNILDDGFTDIGTAVLKGAIDNKPTVIVVEMFGRKKEVQAKNPSQPFSVNVLSYPQDYFFETAI